MHGDSRVIVQSLCNVILNPPRNLSSEWKQCQCWFWHTRTWPGLREWRRSQEGITVGDLTADSQTDSSLWSTGCVIPINAGSGESGLCVSTQKGVRNKRFRSREVGVSERTFHPLLPGECQAEGDRGLQIPLWGSGQCRVFRQYFKPHTHTHSYIHVEDFLWSG